MASLQSLLLASACLVYVATAQIDAQLVGTWSTKSGKVLTGPGFYNPVNDSFIEPSHTGISYSFTADGFYESAYYRAIANPSKPECAQAILQFQHGTAVMNSDLSLSLNPFSVDGRQQQSNPCSTEKVSTYQRYNQTETMSKWQVQIDPYTKLKRLDLYGFDGKPLNPMFLAYTPPQMLPTVTMNPTEVAATPTGKVKRGEEGYIPQLAVPLNKNAIHIKRDPSQQTLLHRVDLNILWWAGVGLTLFGGAAYLL